MISQKDIIEITTSLYGYDSKIQANNKNGYTDINRDMEDISIHILNIVFDWTLHNKNIISKNTKAIDLVDDNKKIVVQVTSETNIKKIRDTYLGFNKLKEKENKYLKYKLYMFFLRNKYNKTDIVKKYIENNYIKDCYCFNDIIDIVKKDEIKLNKLKNYLYLSEQNNSVYTTKIYNYYQKHDKIQNFTTENFNRYIENCKDFFESSDKVLHIISDSGCGKSHLINYIIDKHIDKNYIPILIHNKEATYKIFDDFCKNINWLFIIDDIDFFNNNFLNYIFNYVINEFIDSKIIVTSNVCFNRRS